MSFTPEELAELAAFDAMIDAEPDELTEEEEAAARHVDQVALEKMSSQRRSELKCGRTKHKRMTPEQSAKQNAKRKAKRQLAVHNELLKAFRAYIGLTQADFARAIRVNYYTYIQWEHGIYKPKYNAIGYTFQTFYKFREEWERRNNK